MIIEHNVVYWCKTMELVNEFKQGCEMQKIKTCIITTPKEVLKFRNADVDVVPIVYDEYSMYNYEPFFYTNYEFGEKWRIYTYLGNGASVRYEETGISNIMTYIDNKLKLLNPEINEIIKENKINKEL